MLQGVCAVCVCLCSVTLCETHTHTTCTLLRTCAPGTATPLVHTLRCTMFCGHTPTAATSPCPDRVLTRPLPQAATPPYPLQALRAALASQPSDLEDLQRAMGGAERAQLLEPHAPLLLPAPTVQPEQTEPHTAGAPAASNSWITAWGNTKAVRAHEAQLAAHHDACAEAREQHLVRPHPLLGGLSHC